jgi:hypothetical protein
VCFNGPVQNYWPGKRGLGPSIVGASCLTLLLMGAALAVDAHGQLCQDDYDSCKETCTLKYGASFDTRGRLTECNGQCRSQYRTCVHQKPSTASDAGAAP